MAAPRKKRCVALYMKIVLITFIFGERHRDMGQCAVRLNGVENLFALSLLFTAKVRKAQKRQATYHEVIKRSEAITLGSMAR